MARAMFALGLVAFIPSKLSAQTNSMCATVQLQINQRATLEREAFDAELTIDNSGNTNPYTNLQVIISLTDAAGNPASQNFFIKVSTLTGTNAVDGSGVVQANDSADIHWLIIPSSGSGGTNPAGQQYAVSAQINGISNGSPQNLTTFKASITVEPQPVFKLEYALPFEVFGQEPLLSPVITPVTPFPLVARVTNIGYGPANNFQIQSAQPEIIDNKQGLLVDFNIIGTNVAGQTIPNTLNIAFGTIAPNGVSQAFWNMTATLSGQFRSFTSTYTHSADLGGQLTSLLQSVTTYTLLKDALVDLPGRDKVPDFLVNETGDRSTMGVSLDAGLQPPAEFILESDQPIPVPVTEVPGGISGSLGGTNASLTYSLTGIVSSNVWIHSYAPWPYGKSVALTSAKRTDGKVMNLQNVWISKHFRKSDLTYVYWINILDLTSAAQSYTLQFSPSGLDLPPGAVPDLAGVTYSSGGAVALAWSSPGEDGYTGNLFGAHVFIDAETSPTASFSPANAQVSFATASNVGSLQSFVDSSLIGNATSYIALFTQDTGGNMSSISNLATAYTLPDPPTNLVISTVAATEIGLNWQIGNNQLPIAYQVYAATVTGGAAVSSSPYQDSFTRAAILSRLSPGTTYFLYGLGANPVTGVRGPPAILGSTVTPTSTADLLPPRTTLSAGAPSFSSSTLTYAASATTFTLSAVDDLAIAGDGLGLGVSQTFVALDTTTFSLYYSTQTFSFALEGTHSVQYYSVDLASHTESVELSTVAIDLTPPLTQLSIQGSSFTSSQSLVTLSTSSQISLAAADPVSNGVASGVDQIFFYIDNDPTQNSCFSVALDTTAPAGSCANPDYGGPFSLSPGTHTVFYFAQDNVGNVEDVNIASFTVDGLPPRTALAYGPPSFSSAPVSYVSNETTFNLAVADDLSITGDGTGVGVAKSYLAVDTTTFSLNSGSFTLVAEGLRALSYYSVDLVGNVEPARSTSVAVDLTPPETLLSFGGTALQDAQGRFTISTGTAISLAAADPLSNGVASGVDAIFYYIDADPTSPSCDSVPLDTGAPPGTCADPGYAGAFTLSGGTHTLYFFAQDNAGNLEAVNVASVTVPSAGSMPAPTLTSIAVQPSSATVVVGASQAFAATGRFNDGSSRLLVSTAAWSSRASMPTPRSAFMGGFVNGKLYAIGGQDASGNASSAVEVYDPVADSWTTRGAMPGPRTNGFSAVYNGKIYVIGGCLIAGCPGSSGQTSRVDIYDPAAGAWTSGAAAPSPRYYNTAAVINGKIYAPSGEIGGSNVTSMDVYDPAADSWSSGPAMPVPHAGAGVAALNGLLYMIGGDDASGDSARVDIFDPATGHWTQGASLSSTRFLLGAVVVGGRIHALGGRVNGAASSIDEVYDPGTKAWTVAASMPRVHEAHLAATDGLNAWALGGFVDNVGMVATLDSLRGAEVAWASDNAAVASVSSSGTATAMSTGTAHIAAAAGAVSGQATLTVVPNDILPPRTTLVASAPSFSSAPYVYAASLTSFSLSAVDDLSIVGDGVGVGVAQTFVALDTTTFILYSSSFSFASEGSHSVQYYSVDLDNHVENVETSTVAVDLTAPQTVFSVQGPSFLMRPGVVALSSSSMVALAATDPISNGVASGVDAIFYYIDADPTTPSCDSVALDTTAPAGSCANPGYGGPFSLSVGTHTVYFFAQDNVANAEDVNVASFSVVADDLPPRTTLSFGTPSFSSAPYSYVSDATTMSLAAVDDAAIIGDGAGVGVARTFVAIDTTAFSAYSGAFGLAGEGLHTLNFYGVDFLGHTEAVENAQTAVDLTPPASRLSVFGSTAAGGGTVFIASTTVLSLSASDPVSNGVASGVQGIFYVVDADPFSPACEAVPPDLSQPPGTCADEAYGGSFTLSGGTHAVYFFAEDAVDNQEMEHFSSFTVDAIPPVTTVLVNGTPVISNQVNVSPTDNLSLSASDAGSGVAATFFAPDGQPYNLYGGGSFNVPVGSHTLAVFSVDNVGNREAARTYTVVSGSSTPGQFPPGPDTAVNRSTNEINVFWDAGGNAPGTQFNAFIAAAPSDGSCPSNNPFQTPMTTTANSFVFAGLTPGAFYAIDICNPAVTGGNACDTPLVVGTNLFGFEGNPPYVVCGGGAGQAVNPYPPSPTVVVGRSSGTISLSWAGNNNPFQTLYGVRVMSGNGVCAFNSSSQPGGSSPGVSVSSSAALISGLQAGTTYEILVCAQDSRTGLGVCNQEIAAAAGLGGFEAYPPYGLCSTGTAGGAQVPGPSAVASRDSSSLTLKWGANGNPSGTLYNVVYATSNGSCSFLAQQHSIQVSTTIAQITGLLTGTTYVIDICNPAITGGNSCDTNIVAMTGTDGTENSPPFVSCGGGGPAGGNTPGPSFLTFANNTDPASISLSWEPNGNPSGTVYQVVYATTSGNSCSTPNNLTQQFISTTSIVLSSLSSQTSYYIDVCNQALLTSSGTVPCNQPVIAETASNSLFVCGTSSGPGGGPPPSFGSGQAVGVDASGKFWEIAQAGNGGVLLEKFSSDASTLKSSTTLPGADPNSNWALGFDSSGGVYAVGGSINAQGVSDLAVFKLSGQNILLSSASYDAGGQVNSMVLDAYSYPAGGSLWIAGGLQSGSFKNNTAQIQLALWRYNLQTGVLSLAATFSRGHGGDAGFGVRVASGTVWVAGYSATTSQGLGGSMDLGLWGFDPASGAVSKGPYFVPAVLPNGVQGDLGAKLELAGTSLAFAGSRASSQVGFYEFDQGGNLLLSRAWTPASGPAPVVKGIAADSQGHIAAAGLFKVSTGSTLGVWGYSPDGSFIGAFTDPAAPGGAHGIAFSTKAYLALEGSGAPYKFDFNASLAGTDVLLSSGAAPSDTTPPVTDLLISGAMVVDSQGNTVTGPDAAFELSAEDPVVGGISSGVQATYFAVDQGANLLYRAPFSLAAGTHTIYYYSVDNAGNQEQTNFSPIFVSTAEPGVSISPSTGPIGIPFTISGSGFGTYQGSNTRVRFGGANGSGGLLAPLSVWNDATISGSVPGLSTGAYPVAVEIQTGSTVATTAAGTFLALLPVASTVTPTSAPIGAAFTVSGAHFGPYAGAQTQLLIGGVAASLSVWNDAAIAGTVPGAAPPGLQPLLVQRTTGDGGLMTSATIYFNVATAAVATFSPSAGPIGIPFTISGSNFGNYAGSNSRVRFGQGGPLAPLAVWNDTTISGTVPGLSTGAFAVFIERQDGATISSVQAATFTVQMPLVASLSPTSGPIGQNFTITGSGFGPYAGNLTKVKFGNATASLSVWNDTTISGAVPGAVASGQQTVLVQIKTSDNGVMSVVAGSFTVIGPMISLVDPSTGPIGVPFTISGSHFGSYNGANTVVLIGGATAPLSVWNDTTISGTIPNLSTGAYSLVVERIDSGVTSASAASTFTVLAPQIASVVPSAGPIGVSLTVTGTHFGPYSGSATLMLIGGATAQLSVWNDTTITGSVPGLPPGAYPLVVERTTSDGGIMQAAAAFQVTGINGATLSPSTGPIGIPFTISGSGFGNYNGSNTRVRFGAGGPLAPLSVWNDTTISGSVPGLSTGAYAVIIELQSGANVAVSTVATFGVIAPNVSTMSPSAGPIGAQFTLTGAGFGPYGGGATRVLVGGFPAPLSVWNDTTISGTIPGAVSMGGQPVVIVRTTSDGGDITSSTVTFSVTTPAVASLTPSSAPIGAPFTITGTSFGAYAGSLTRVKIGGVLAPLSVWNDATISGSVPGSVAAGSTTLVIEIATSDGGLVTTAAQPFTVVTPQIDAISPLSGTAGSGFQLTGNGFGPYQGGASQVLFAGVAASLSVWNDQQIVGVVPDSLAVGTYTVTVALLPSGGSASSNGVWYTVTSGGSGPSAMSAMARVASPSGQNAPSWYYQAALKLPAAHDGFVTTPGRASVSVPRAAISSSTLITIGLPPSGTKDAAHRASALDSAGYAAVGLAHQFGPDGSQFGAPVTITLPYDPASLPMGETENQLVLGWWNPVSGSWQALNTQVDTVHKRLSAQTSHFSIYQPLMTGVATMRPAIPMPGFGFTAAYSFPNPSHGGQAVTIRGIVGLADSVDVTIREATGRIVRTGRINGATTAHVDGRTQHVFDYVWDVHGFGTGVYLFTLTAHKTGEAPVSRSGKIAVIP